MMRHEKIELLGYCLFMFGFSLPFVMMRTKWEPLYSAPVFVDIAVMGVPFFLGIAFICYGIWMGVKDRAGLLRNTGQTLAPREKTRTSLFLVTVVFAVFLCLMYLTWHDDPRFSWVFVVAFGFWVVVLAVLLF